MKKLDVADMIQQVLLAYENNWDAQFPDTLVDFHYYRFADGIRYEATDTEKCLIEIELTAQGFNIVHKDANHNYDVLQKQRDDD